jgi:hypothetical protein
VQEPARSPIKRIAGSSYRQHQAVLALTAFGATVTLMMVTYALERHHSGSSSGSLRLTDYFAVGFHTLGLNRRLMWIRLERSYHLRGERVDRPRSVSRRTRVLCHRGGLRDLAVTQAKEAHGKDIGPRDQEPLGRSGPSRVWSGSALVQAT